MPSRVKPFQGPALASLLSLLLAAGQHLGRDLPIAAAPGGYPLASLWGALWAGSFAPWVSLLLLSAALGGVLMALVRCWTGNSVVSLSAALLVAGHPGLPTAVLVANQALILLPTVLLLAAFLAREVAYQDSTRGRSPLRWELIGWGLAIAAAFSGPAGLAALFLVPLVEVVFHRGPGALGVRRHIPLFCLYGVTLLILGAFLGPTTPEGFENQEGLGRLFLLSQGLPAGWARGAVWAILAVAAALPLAAGVWSYKRAPRWLLLHLGFAGAWVVGCEGFELLGLLPRGPWMAPLQTAGAAFGVSTGLWRLLTAMWPEVREEASPPAPPSEETLLALAAPSGAPTPPAGPEVLDAALQGALLQMASNAAKVARDPKIAELSPGQWEAYERAWVAEGQARGQRLLSAALVEKEERRSLYESRILPMVEAGALVVDLGPGPDGLAARCAQRGARVLCVSRDAERLRPAAPPFAPGGSPWSLRGGLEALAPGRVDLVLGIESFRGLDLAALFRQLRQIHRVLTPLGSAFLSLPDLSDPGGFDAFVQAVDDGASCGHFITPELVRRLAGGSGFVCGQIVQQASDRDLLVHLEKAPFSGAGGEV